MASIQKVKVGPYTYYRIVESRRVNGKPRLIPILHLGTAEQLLDRLLAQTQPQLKVRSYQHGDVAALKAMADRLDLITLIDRHLPASRRALSVGTSLLLAAINRAVWPCSKRSWASWAERTSIPHLFALQPAALTSQHFWDQMDVVSQSALEAMERDLTRKVIQDFDLTLDTLFYDTSNFFTYLDSTNTRSELAQRGRSKQKRTDLRQFSLALLVARDGQIPLYSYVYEGNRVDAKQFPDSLTAIRQRVEQLVSQVEDLTLVYDRGNNSKAKSSARRCPAGALCSVSRPDTARRSDGHSYRVIYSLRSRPFSEPPGLSLSPHTVGRRAHPRALYQPDLTTGPEARAATPPQQTS